MSGPEVEQFTGRPDGALFPYWTIGRQWPGGSELLDRSGWLVLSTKPHFSHPLSERVYPKGACVDSYEK